MTDLVDNPADVTFTDESRMSQNKIDLGDDCEFEFSLDHSMRDESRPSIVADLLDSRKQSILSQAQIDKLKFCEDISAKANQLKPISSNHKVSEKV